MLKFQHIFDGDLGIWQTINEMRRLALSASVNPAIQYLVSKLVRPDWSTEHIISTLETYTQQHILYVNDPQEFEYVKDPVLIITEIRGKGIAEGDCDDHTTFLSALLTACNIPNAIVALALPSQGEGFNHVVNGIPMGGNQYMLLDTSVKERKFVYEIDKSMAVRVL